MNRSRSHQLPADSLPPSHPSALSSQGDTRATSVQPRPALFQTLSFPHPPPSQNGMHPPSPGSPDLSSRLCPPPSLLAPRSVIYRDGPAITGACRWLTAPGCFMLLSSHLLPGPLARSRPRLCPICLENSLHFRSPFKRPSWQRGSTRPLACLPHLSSSSSAVICGCTWPLSAQAAPLGPETLSYSYSRKV